ncbi:putative RNA methyltransferase [Nitrospira sp.]|nr:putative RNA methyltransferase [Nitrospira sp.]
MIVEIEKLVQGGYGLARQDGRTIFVRGAIPGETVEVVIGQTHKHYQEAVMKRVVETSSDRVSAPCPVYGECGGCQLQHIGYDAQLRLKREMLLETLARVGKVALPEISPIIPSTQIYGSRSVVRFGVLKQGTGLALGFHRESSHALVPVTDCLVLPDILRNIVTGLSKRLANVSKPPCRIESIEIRLSSTFGQAVLSLRSQARSKRQAEILFGLCAKIPGVVGCIVMGTAAVRNARWVHGQEWIAERLDDMVVRISDQSFLQSNWPVNRALSDLLIEWVAPAAGLRVLELYAGVGTLGLPLAKRGAFVTFVEGNRVALADARRAANGNHVGRCRFRPVAAETFLVTATPGEYDVVLVDPPRTGLRQEVLSGVLQLEAPRIVYVSCDPATLARDVARLASSGYRVTRVQAFDMFPQTSHLETVTELQRSPR